MDAGPIQIQTASAPSASAGAPWEEQLPSFGKRALSFAQSAPVRPKPLILVIIDGWGLGSTWGGNAIVIARTPNMDRLWREYPHSSLLSFGEAVGLPTGERGNSEVGHLTIGAGRIVHQDLPAITKTITEGSFFKNPALLEILAWTRAHNKNLHLAGLVSAGGIHSHLEHLFALLDLCKQQNMHKVFIHMFTDGRDSKPTDALLFLEHLQRYIRRVGVGRVISVAGRYFAMDRDKRWERIQKTYDALTRGYGLQAQTPEQAIAQAYRQGYTDEFIPPTVIARPEEPFVPIASGDAVISFNFRADRTRQIHEAFLDPAFGGFPRAVVVQHLKFASFVFHKENDQRLPIIRVFKPEVVTDSFAEYLSQQGLRQLHIAETEKYAHITYFFNGGHEEPFPGEDRVLIASPKVTTYNQKPQMATKEIADAVVDDIERAASGHDVIVVNFAAPDMVGHTGDFNAAIRSCEAVDHAIGRIAEAALGKAGLVAITGDHGNVEEMVNHSTGLPDTEHVADPVPFILVGSNARFRAPLRSNGGLIDVAPTLLSILGLPIPHAMTGTSLFLPAVGGLS